MLFRRLRGRRRQRLAERTANTARPRPEEPKTRIRSFLSGQRE